MAPISDDYSSLIVQTEGGGYTPFYDRGVPPSFCLNWPFPPSWLIINNIHEFNYSAYQPPLQQTLHTHKNYDSDLFWSSRLVKRGRFRG